MRPFTSTIDFDEALRRVLAAAAPVARTEELLLLEADGRVAAVSVSSAIDVPAFDRATMDGYAVIADDVAAGSKEEPATLTVVGRRLTGDVTSQSLARGACVEIATGAPLPAGADAVVMVETTERAGDIVRIIGHVEAGQHIGRRGADVAAGAVVVRAGDVLTPARLGALAAVGVDRGTVYARPTVAIVSTGNEVSAHGRPLGAGHVYDVNRFTLSALAGRHGAEVTSHAPVPDSVAGLVSMLDALADHDLIVLSGGSSVGDRDLVRDAVQARGDIVFHGVAVRPGKPTLFGRAGRSLIFGMPGNPASCLSNGYVLLVPLVRALARLPPWVPRVVQLPLSRRVTSVAGRRQFYTVRIVDGRAEPAFKASGDITSMADADGYIDIAADSVALEQGTTVAVKLF